MSHKYAVTCSNRRHTVRNGSKNRLVFFKTARSVSLFLKKLPMQRCFDVWRVNEKAGSWVPDKVILSSVPGFSGSQDYFPHRYSPLPEEHLLTQRAVPIGDYYPIQNLVGESPQKPFKWHQHEIEQILVSSDLNYEDLKTARTFLQQPEMLLSFLTSRGHKDVSAAIQRLVSYG